MAREEIKLLSFDFPWNHGKPESRANIRYGDSGVEGMLYISKIMGSHGVRVKYMLRGGSTSISLSVSDNPLVIQDSNDRELTNMFRKHKEDIIKWIKLNEKIIIDFWNDPTISDIDLRNKLKKIR